MFLFSSVGSLTSHQAHQAETEADGDGHLETPADLSASISDAPSTTDDASRTLSAYHANAIANDGHSINSEDNSDTISYGGTIIASLSSRDVARNLTASRTAISQQQPPRMEGTTPHPLTETTHRLSEVETVRSDALSFTPTMAEQAGSLLQHDTTQHTSNQSLASEQSSSRRSTTESQVPTIGIQPEFCIACPFCDREKDLQWRLTQEREQSHDLKVSEHRTRFLLGATIVMGVVAVISFFVGKAVSDMQSQEVISHYMAQCNDMISQKDEEELYWKIVTAAFTAMVNAMAGPLANIMLGAGGK